MSKIFIVLLLALAACVPVTYDNEGEVRYFVQGNKVVSTSTAGAIERGTFDIFADGVSVSSDFCEGPCEVNDEGFVVISTAEGNYGAELLVATFSGGVPLGGEATVRAGGVSYSGIELEVP